MRGLIHLPLLPLAAAVDLRIDLREVVQWGVVEAIRGPRGAGRPRLPKEAVRDVGLHAEKRVSFFEFPSVSVGPEPVLAN